MGLEHMRYKARLREMVSSAQRRPADLTAVYSCLKTEPDLSLRSTVSSQEAADRLEHEKL